MNRGSVGQPLDLADRPRASGTTSERVWGFCPHCGHRQLFFRSEIHHRFHLFLSIITAGLWLVSWVAVVIIHRLRPWHCSHCGCSRPVFPPEK
jgi:hypothetical protein